MEDIPYSDLKEDQRAYDMMMLRDQYNVKFADIARNYKISTARVRQIYDTIKVRQARLYIRHISIALGHENMEKIKKVFVAANECYQDWSYACAYLEKKYKKILAQYRDGEPGASKQMIENLPPLKQKMSKETMSRIVEMRENEKATYAAIAKEMRITPEKARHTYNRFYHQQVLDYIDALEKKAKSKDEKLAIWSRYFRNNKSAKKRYEMMMEEKRERGIE